MSFFDHRGPILKPAMSFSRRGLWPIQPKKNTQDFLEREMAFLRKEYFWLLPSPDLNPMDYSSWRQMKD